MNILRKTSNNKNAFTLTEMCVIFIVIAILATLAITNYLKIIEKSTMSEAWAFLGKLKNTEAIYYLNNQNYISYCVDQACTNPLSMEWPHFSYYDHLVLYGCPGSNCNEWWVMPFRESGEDASTNPPVVAALYKDKPGCRQHSFMRLDTGKKGYTSCASGNTTITFLD